MQVEQINTAALVPYARNSRTHSDEQVAQVAASIREFGFTNPVLIDSGNGIIAGHGRVLAARQIGMETVPCIRLDHLTEAQKRAYIIADNKLALNAGWDEAMLAEELGWLDDLGDFDMGLAGFDADDLGDLPGAAPHTDCDFTPPDTDGYKEQYAVVVSCRDEAEQQVIYEKLKGMGYACKVVAT